MYKDFNAIYIYDNIIRENEENLWTLNATAIMKLLKLNFFIDMIEILII